MTLGAASKIMPTKSKNTEESKDAAIQSEGGEKEAPPATEESPEESAPMDSGEAPEPEQAPVQVAPPPAGSQFCATGRRKRAVARVTLKPGTGAIVINRRPIEKYFSRDLWKMTASRPLHLTETHELFDIKVKVRGGGLSGQAGAVCHALARALCVFNIELRTKLKKAGLMTRDARKVERKKYGLAGARKRYQFSKR